MISFDGYMCDDLPKPGSEPELGDIAIRQSTMAAMEKCPARIGYADHEGYKDPFSEPLVFGSLVHAQLSFVEENKLDALSIVGDNDLFITLLNSTLETYSHVPDSVPFDQWKEESFKALMLWRREVKPKLSKPLMIEKLLYRPLGRLDGRTVWLRGQPDHVDPTKINDWKTAVRGWDKTTAQFSKQPSCYLPLVNFYLPKWKKDTFTFWVWNRQKEGWEEHPTRRNPAQVDSVLRTAWQYAMQIWLGVYPAKPTVTEYFKEKRAWYCSPKYCPAWDICEFKYLPDDVDESETKEVSL